MKLELRVILKESFSRSNLTQAARQSWSATSHWLVIVMAEALSKLEEVMSLRDHMEGIKDWLASETMQQTLRRLMEEALREKVTEVYAKITWSEKDDEKGMSFIGLQQWSFALLSCFGECNQRTHVSNPQTAGKYCAAFIWVGWTKSERHG